MDKDDRAFEAAVVKRKVDRAADHAAFTKAWKEGRIDLVPTPKARLLLEKLNQGMGTDEAIAEINKTYPSQN